MQSCKSTQKFFLIKLLLKNANGNESIKTKYIYILSVEKDFIQENKPKNFPFLNKF